MSESTLCLRASVLEANQGHGTFRAPAQWDLVPRKPLQGLGHSSGNKESALPDLLLLSLDQGYTEKPKKRKKRVNGKLGKGLHIQKWIADMHHCMQFYFLHAPFSPFIYSSIHIYINLKNNQREALKTNQPYLGPAEWCYGLLSHSKWCACLRKGQLTCKFVFIIRVYRDAECHTPV